MEPRESARRALARTAGGASVGPSFRASTPCRPPRPSSSDSAPTSRPRPCGARPTAATCDRPGSAGRPSSEQDHLQDYLACQAEAIRHHRRLLAQPTPQLSRLVRHLVRSSHSTNATRIAWHNGLSASRASARRLRFAALEAEGRQARGYDRSRRCCSATGTSTPSICRAPRPSGTGCATGRS